MTTQVNIEQAPTGAAAAPAPVQTPVPAPQSAAAPAAAAPAAQPETPAPAVGPVTSKDFDPLFQEFSKNGAISEASYKALEARGLARDVIDGHIAGRAASVQNRAAELVGSIGGPGEAARLQAWAAQPGNLTEGETKILNEAIEHGDLGQAKLMLQGLKARAFPPVPGAVQLSATGGAVPSGPKPFKDMQAVHEMQRDPKYKVDSEFRDLFDARFAASTHLH